MGLAQRLVSSTDFIPEDPHRLAFGKSGDDVELYIFYIHHSGGFDFLRYFGIFV
jgi:hypothetical protein